MKKDAGKLGSMSAVSRKSRYDAITISDELGDILHGRNAA